MGTRDRTELRSRLPRFFARFLRLVAHTEAHAYLLKEVERWRPACEDPHKVVGNLLLRALHIDDHRFGFELDRHGIEQGLYPERMQSSIRF